MQGYLQKTKEGMMSRQKRSPVKRFFMYACLLLLIVILYYTRSFWPLIFMGEPIATIHATIPTDKKLRVGIGFESSICEFVTASDGSLINAGRGWSKLYSPDRDGKVTVKVYSQTLSLCDWKMEGFAVAVANDSIPDYVYESPLIPDDIKKSLRNDAQKYGEKGRYADVSFNLGTSKENLPTKSYVIKNELVANVYEVKNPFNEKVSFFKYGLSSSDYKSEVVIQKGQPFEIHYTIGEDKNSLVFIEESIKEKTRFETTGSEARKQTTYKY